MGVGWPVGVGVGVGLCVGVAVGEDRGVGVGELDGFGLVDARGETEGAGLLVDVGTDEGLLLGRGLGMWGPRTPATFPGAFMAPPPPLQPATIKVAAIHADLTTPDNVGPLFAL